MLTAHWHYQGYIRQMRSAGEWIVNRDDVTRSDLDLAQRGGHGHGHRPQMHGHMIALRNHSP